VSLTGCEVNNGAPAVPAKFAQGRDHHQQHRRRGVGHYAGVYLCLCVCVCLNVR